MSDKYPSELQLNFIHSFVCTQGETHTEGDPIDSIVFQLSTYSEAVCRETEGSLSRWVWGRPGKHCPLPLSA